LAEVSTGRIPARARKASGSPTSTGGPGGTANGAGSESAYVALLAAYFAFGVIFQAFPPMFGRLEAQFDLSRTAVSLVMSLFLAPLMVIALPGGTLADRYGAPVTGHAGFCLLVAGAVMTAMAPSFSLLLAGRVLSGIGAGLLFVAALKLVTDRFPVERRGLAVGVFVAGLPVGTGVAFDLLGPIGAAMGWRAVALAAVVLALGAWAAFAATAGPTGPRVAADVRRPATVLRDREMLWLVTVTTFGYTAIIGFTTWAPTTFARYAHVSPGWAAAIASLLLVIDIPFAPLWGWLSDRLRRRRPFILAAFVVYALGSLVVPPAGRFPAHLAGLILLVATGIMGVGCSMFFPAALAIPNQRVPSASMGTAYGMLLTAQAAGMMVGPVIVGRVLDMATAPAGFLTVSALTLLGLIAATRLRSP
jgi:MFS family permease